MVFAISFCLSERSKRTNSYANYYEAGYNGNFYEAAYNEDFHFSKYAIFPSFHHDKARKAVL